MNSENEIKIFNISEKNPLASNKDQNNTSAHPSNQNKTSYENIKNNENNEFKIKILKMIGQNNLSNNNLLSLLIGRKGDCSRHLSFILCHLLELCLPLLL